MIFTEPTTINYEQRLQCWIESDHRNDGVDLFPDLMKNTPSTGPRHGLMAANQAEALPSLNGDDSSRAPNH